MATLTTNLFHGQGEANHRLDVIDGHWPADMAGWVFVVGPDKRKPGGHWFGAHGLLCRIDCTPDADGRVAVRHRRVRTPLERLSQRFPRLFATIKFVEVSPFGFTNMANTNVEPIDGRLFIGFDAGRPVEVDPATLDFVTSVGRTDEWLQGAPGLVEPLVSVAAHPAAAHDEHALYFVNYAAVPPQRPSIARWGLNGPVDRWPIEGMGAFDSIHDVKACHDYLVISDLPFVVEPQTFLGKPRTRPNQDDTQLWIIDKQQLRDTPPGSPVRAVPVTIPMPTGHLSLDEEHAPGEIIVYLEHIPLADLMLQLDASSKTRDGRAVPAAYEGLVELAVQPGAVGRYRIDAATGEVLERDLATDDRFWGPVLATRDNTTPRARATRRHCWFVGVGFDPDLLTDEWWRLYATGGNTALVEPADLPDAPKPGALAHVDLESMKVTEVYAFENGEFPSPPTFVPRLGSEDPDDGYIIVIVHQDGPKEIQVFDAHDIERGPLARATANSFNPSLLLHSCWMPERTGPRPSRYRVRVGADVLGSIRSLPQLMRSLGATGREMRRMLREQSA
jgi:carotenoid cleavage dioxygenase-like enzyme